MFHLKAVGIGLFVILLIILVIVLIVNYPYIPGLIFGLAILIGVSWVIGLHLLSL